MAGPAASLSPSSESVELNAAFFVFFAAGSRGGGGESGSADFLLGSWASINNPEPELESSAFLLSAGTGERVPDGPASGEGFSSIGGSSSELSVAESSSDFGLSGPALRASNDLCCDFVPSDTISHVQTHR